MGVLLDAGSGLFRLPPLVRSPRLDILLSHAHLDHTLGLTFLLGIRHRCALERVVLWGEGEKLEAIRRHLFHPLIFPVPLEAEWNAVDGLDEFRVGGATVTWRQQSHPGGSIAYRLDWPGEGPSIVYATDTAGDHPAETLDWMRGADLLMHECSIGDGGGEWAEKTGHTWSGRLAEIVRQAEPRRVLLTHADPTREESGLAEADQVAREFGGRVEHATDGMVLEVASPAPGGAP